MDSDGRMRVRAAFAKFHEQKATKAKAKAYATQGNRSQVAGKNSYEVRERHLRHLEEVLNREGITHIGMMCQAHVDTALEECVESIIPRASDEVSPNTLRSAVASFKTFIRWHCDRGSIPRSRYTSLVENLPSIKTHKRKMLIIPGTAWPDIFKIAHKRHIMDRVILELGFYLAMRISEARMVRWKDLDLAEGQVQFGRDKQNDDLRLYVHPDLRATLLELRQWLEDQGMPPEPNWPIVLARQVGEYGAGAKVQPTWACKPGVPMDPITVRKGLKIALLEFGVAASEMICQGMHITRRSRACHLFREGVDIRIIAKILGHTDFRVTLDYIRDGLDEAEMREAMSMPLRVQEVEVYNNAEQAGNLNTPAVAQTKQAQAMAVLTLVNSGALSEEEAAVLLSRMIQ